MPREKIYKTKKQKLKAQYKQINESHKKYTKIISVRYHTENDKLILSKLDSVSNKADYIRQLILADIAANSDEKKS